MNIDLRTDLVKIDEARPYLGKCDYAAPCAIGAMVPEDQRADLDAWANPKATFSAKGQSIGALIEHGVVTAPKDQHADLNHLQDLFDGGWADEYDRLVEELKEKYHAGA